MFVVVPESRQRPSLRDEVWAMTYDVIDIEPSTAAPCLAVSPILCPLTTTTAKSSLTTDMPLPGFISSIADKAQYAINQTPLAGHIPGTAAHSAAATTDGPTANQAAAQGGKSNHTLDALHHQLRQFGQQYTCVRCGDRTGLPLTAF